MKRSEEQFTYITQMLSSITEGKRKYTEPDEAAEKRARTSVESLQQPGPSSSLQRKGQNVSCLPKKEKASK